MSLTTLLPKPVAVVLFVYVLHTGPFDADGDGRSDSLAGLTPTTFTAGIARVYGVPLAKPVEVTGSAPSERLVLAMTNSPMFVSSREYPAALVLVATTWRKLNKTTIPFKGMDHEKLNRIFNYCFLDNIDLNSIGIPCPWE